ncbi:probable tRNA(His) guanylyltransferase [Teleopsis dalmanni]|uniref:probable tRNA(His) guanylyltransferase n=1 Tax=Teleopsis dalmanni TaxID=139649 RepID=UPI000D32BA87|nr:probable tRNA(His) guanylyltransferase [Teleopsis dalmanni]
MPACKILKNKIITELIKCFHTSKMACSRYEYVKTYEREDNILPNVWIVVRVDGKGFHKFSKIHNFEKPNDENALNLMNYAAMTVMTEFRDIVLSFGQSDEYSFVFRKESNIYNRRASKLLSYVTSLFTSAYVMNWMMFLPNTKLQYPPCFDGRVVLYPSDQNLRDYLSWRQADVHINNLYNTAFWNLVQQAGLTAREAEAELRGTISSDKNELLFSKFGINYNNLPTMFRKGTILLRKRVRTNPDDCIGQLIVPMHEDMIRNQFWNTHTELLGKYLPGEYLYNCNTTEDLSNILLEKQMETLKLNNIKKEEL